MYFIYKGGIIYPTHKLFQIIELNPVCPPGKW